jgi:hypothetical protein
MPMTTAPANGRLPKVAHPKSMTAAEFFGTDDLGEQLAAVAKSDGWAIPAHLIPDLCRRAAEQLQAQETK